MITYINNASSIILFIYIKNDINIVIIMNQLLNNCLMACDNIESVLVNQNKIKMLNEQKCYFTHEIKTLPTISNQKMSGRCWMFANLYYFRTAMISKYNLDPDFDFSTSWLYFYDKLEKFRHGLQLLCDDEKLRNSNSKTSLEYASYIYLDDGGNMDALLNLVEKYGLVPKECYGESINTEKTNDINNLVKRLFKIYAFKLKQCEDDNSRVTILNMAISECTTLLEYILGKPPSEFIWQYRGNDNVTKSREILHNGKPFKRLFYNSKKYTPMEYWQLVEASAPLYLSRVFLTNDPCKDVHKHILGIRECTNIHERMGDRSYFTMNMENILKYVKSSIRLGLPVIVSCAVHNESYYDKKIGVMDHNLYSYDELCPSLKGFNSLKDSVLSGIEYTNHVMCIVGYNVLNDTWKISNSWGSECGYSGYWIATTEWFNHRLCKFNIPQSILDKEIAELIKMPADQCYKLGDSTE